MSFCITAAIFDPVVLKPGVVVAIPAEAKHWHGAAKDSWMQHLTCLYEKIKNLYDSR